MEVLPNQNLSVIRSCYVLLGLLQVKFTAFVLVLGTMIPLKVLAHCVLLVAACFSILGMEKLYAHARKRIKKLMIFGFATKVGLATSLLHTQIVFKLL